MTLVMLFLAMASESGVSGLLFLLAMLCDTAIIITLALCGVIT